MQSHSKHVDPSKPSSGPSSQKIDKIQLQIDKFDSDDVMAKAGATGVDEEIGRTMQEVIDDVVTVWRGMDHQKGVNGYWETGVASELDGADDWRIAGEAREVWKRHPMDQIRLDAIADVNKRAFTDDGDLKSFADVRKVIVDPLTTGEYRYGEEYEGDMPKKGEHSVTAADLQAEKAPENDLANLSNSVTAIPGAESLAEHEAGLIMAKIGELKAVMADNARKGVPGCKYLLTKRIRDVESCKEGLEKGPSMATIACLHHKLRLERLTNVNERDIARAQYSTAKRKKAMQKLLKAQIKKRMWKRKMNMKAKKELIMKGGTCFTTDELGN